MQKLDILVFAVHPDDAELGCSGTIAKYIASGYKVGIVDFTTGELGTRGSGEIRLQESDASAKVLKLAVRENLFMRDGFFKNDEEHQMSLIKVLRKYQPEIVLANAPEDRHPDHGRAAALATEACFYAGLRRISTKDNDGNEQTAWRPKNLFHFIQDRYLEPDFVIDITDFWETKDASIRAFKTQFFDPNNKEPSSYISSPEFIQFVEARAKEMGHKIGVKYGEGFIKSKTLKVEDLFGI